MFTWVCPQCGREVPPSYTECPDCKNAAANPPQPNQPQAPPPPAAHPQGPPQQQQQYAPPQYGQAMPPYYPPPRREMKLPVGLLTILFSVGIGGAVFGSY